MQETSYVAPNGVTVVTHGTPDPALLRRAVEAMCKSENREGENANAA